MELFEYIDMLQKPYDIFYTDSVHSPLHWHYYSEILYIISGSVRIGCNNREKILYQGDICYFYPLQLHEVTAHDACMETVRYAVIKFNIHTINIPEAYLKKVYDCFVRRTSEEDFCLVLHEDKEEGSIEALVQNIVTEYESRQEMYMLAVQSGIHSLLIAIARRVGKTNRIQKAKHTDLSLSFYHILEYIDTHSSEQLEVQKLAEMCHMSYSNFARLFRENYGRSCFHCRKRGKVVFLGTVRQGFQIFGVFVMGNADTSDSAVFCELHAFLSADNAVIGQLIAGDTAFAFDKPRDGDCIRRGRRNLIKCKFGKCRFPI